MGPLFAFPRLGPCRGLWLALLMLAGGSLAAHAADERFAFSANDYDASLASYRIDTQTGKLHFLRYYPLGKSTPVVVVDPSGRFVLATSQSIDRVFVFRLNRRTGDLQTVPGSPFDVGGRAPFQIEFHPSGRFVYMAHRFAGVGAYTFDVTSGAVTPLPGSPFPAGARVRSVVLSASGRHLYALNAHDNTLSVFRVDPKTGRLSLQPQLTTPVSDVKGVDYLAQQMQEIPPTAGGLPYHMTSDPARRFLFVTNAATANVSVFRIDDETGAVREVGGSPFFTGFNPYSATVDPAGRRLYVVLVREHKIAVHDIDAETGRLTPVAGSPFATGGKRPTQIVFTHDGHRAYTNNRESNDISQLAVDAGSGALSVVDVVKTRTAPWSVALADGEADVPVSTQLLATKQTKDGGALALLSADLQGLARAPVDTRPSAVALRAGSSHAYTVNPEADSISAFALDVAKSRLTPLGEVAVGKQPSAIATDVNGWYLYVTNQGDNTMTVLFMDPETGLPKEVRGSPVKTGRDPVAVTLDPASRYAFVVNRGANNVSVYRYRSNVTPLIFESIFYNSPYAVGREPMDLAVDPSGRYAYVANSADNTIGAYRIHHETGAMAPLPGSPFPAGRRPLALAAHPSGRFLLAANRDSRDISLFRIETALGAIAPFARPLKLPLTPKKIWLSARGDEGYVLAADGRHVLRFSFDADTGAMALLGNVKSDMKINDLLPVAIID